MCGCKDLCSESRCNGCAGINWNAFSWRLVAPASAGSMVISNIRRRFVALDTVMKYPGVCSCVWINYLGEEGLDINGTYNPSAEWHPIASSWSLSYSRSGDRFTWKLYISRYTWEWSYWETLYGLSYGEGWHWGEWGPGTFGQECNNGFGAFGYPGYGFGWGGYAWGYGFDPSYWGIGNGGTAEYQLVGTWDCLGKANHFVRVDPAPGTVIGYVADSWPAFVDVGRIALTGKAVGA
jgi:hypothetical protein